MCYVPKEDRDFMQFFWFRGNNPNEDLVEYRALVHIFGNRPSPAVATFALRAACRGQEAPRLARTFIEDHFYMDDGLGTAQSEEEAINILREARRILAKFNIRLHKIASNRTSVMAAFPDSEVAEEIKDLWPQDHHAQGTLGMTWNLREDRLSVTTTIPDRPFTRRGVLGTVNALYDNIGFISPVILAGRLFQRSVIPRKADGDPSLQELDWDDPLPDRYSMEWEAWKTSLSSLHLLTIPRALRTHNFHSDCKQELHVFFDASQDAIGNVIYSRSVQGKNVYVAFLNGESKVAPRQARSIPRLELCAVVGAAQDTVSILRSLKKKPDQIYYYTNSLVVLGYLRNRERRFSKYVTRRVELILNTSSASQWRYISTEQNPGDVASRPSDPHSLLKTCWLTGPPFLRQSTLVIPGIEPPSETDQLPEFEEANPRVLKVAASPLGGRFDQLFLAHGWWDIVAWRVSRIIWKLCRFRSTITAKRAITLETLSPMQAQDWDILALVRDAQAACFSLELSCLASGKTLPQGHRFVPLAPFQDNEGVLSVGGRLRWSEFPYDYRHPILIPRKHPITQSILEHCHRKINHQGRHVTAGAVRESGFHVEGSAKEIRQLIA
ncbi:uncharacterized protein LOC131882394 [Tigriopus californicus]|uniref:uncharacterized protein LOC131882394 n=1 Tax=Tigriopus californicus TaxID=6832 RepID=UPI0027DA7A4A|nr:uncharacterized protein LOC131882394 [Tigriopus californicus]